ncbi:RNA 2',3'-cyclic phosphodiesterase [Actinotalea sp. M2MS4P-6]|uniref:RNA 2',3'-cyclic phosphodiesterase n=1 Tax=Actinotalea sp. M2MS4P-6 TaxID=2983762 RepID=UPI0021E37189|nr:RNA 2',3'-cyclic phosphodiesterase [Actinotalea sp. M2MS4P-6]MCV2393391.1 RNA 2',3'-cyclic phosphodiesterase [Actinotalea sp. M2MS4P-6]
MRLFASVRPPVPVLDHLRDALALTTAGVDAPVRWTAEENWHLTVAFFGEVPEGAVPDLLGAVAEVAARTTPFELRLRGAGVFSGRTMWIGTSGQTEAMATLAAALRQAGELVSSFRDTRERMRPHLTVGRVVDDGSAARRACARDRSRLPGPVDHLVHALALYEGPSWRVGELLVEESWPGQGRGGGPRYAVRASARLG